MSTTNYFSGIVKILENPKQKVLNNKISVTTFRGEISQVRKNKLVVVNSWGNLAQEIDNYYEMNDYILIEGVLSIKNTPTKNSIQKPHAQIIITVLKVYPFLLKSNRSIIKI